MTPQNLKLEVEKLEWLSKKVLFVEFLLIDPQEVSFIPGQHISLIVAPGITRPYCMNSDSRIKNKLSIAVSVAHKGIGSNFLKNLKTGDEVEALGPLGRLKLKEEHKPHIIFIATGTGVSPMISMLTELRHQNCQSEMLLYFGVRNSTELFYIDKLEEFKQTLPNFDYKIVYSRPEEDWQGLTGYVNDVMDFENLDSQNTQFYIVGHKDMVTTIKQKLNLNGVSEENII